MREILLITITGFCLSSAKVSAASFDCSKAASAHEHLVCSDPMLSDKDSRLNDLYQDVLRLSDESNLIRDDERSWLDSQISTAKRGESVSQASEAYSKRIDELLLDKAALQEVELGNLNSKCYLIPLVKDLDPDMFEVLNGKGCKVQGAGTIGPSKNFAFQTVSAPVADPTGMLSNQEAAADLIFKVTSNGKGKLVFWQGGGGFGGYDSPYYIPNTDLLVLPGEWGGSQMFDATLLFVGVKQGKLIPVSVDDSGLNLPKDAGLYPDETMDYGTMIGTSSVSLAGDPSAFASGGRIWFKYKLQGNKLVVIRSLYCKNAPPDASTSPDFPPKCP